MIDLWALNQLEARVTLARLPCGKQVPEQSNPKSVQSVPLNTGFISKFYDYFELSTLIEY